MSNKLKVDSGSAILVSIDMQDKVIDITWDNDVIRPRAAAFTAIARLLNVPLIKVEHVPHKMGPTTTSINEAMGNADPIAKASFSAFGSEEFKEKLKASGRNKIMIFGVEAHVCVCQTALDAISHGYSVFVLADACSSTSPYHRDIAYDRMRQAGVVIATAQSLAFELLDRADRPEFKQALPFIKDL